MGEYADFFADIPGARELVDWFGSVPSFHDAEILDLHLNRYGTSLLRVHTWLMTNELDEKGYFRLEKHVVVTFALENITGLALQGFNHQNVIDGLRVKRYDKSDETTVTAFANQFPPNAGDYAVTLEPCYGIDGVIYAQQLHISFLPGKPEKNF